MVEPTMPTRLKQMASPNNLPINAVTYYSLVLRSLAEQLGVQNEFYTPLFEAANLLDGR